MRYEVLPAEADTRTQLYKEQELSKSHTAFAYEKRLFEAIGMGDSVRVQQYYEAYLSSEFVMGQMSSNRTRQFRYWAVSGIAVAVHYAILGGADETDAFNLSDLCIRYVDQEQDEERIMNYLREKLMDLTYMVYYARMSGVTSQVVRSCLHYIHLHLQERMTMQVLAKACLVSPSYLASQFRKEMKMSVMDYVRRQKIAAAKLRLEEGIPVGKVAYEYGFCSQTHFIETYKRYEGSTPMKRR